MDREITSNDSSSSDARNLYLELSAWLKSPAKLLLDKTVCFWMLNHLLTNLRCLVSWVKRITTECKWTIDWIFNCEEYCQWTWTSSEKKTCKALITLCFRKIHFSNQTFDRKIFFEHLDLYNRSYDLIKILIMDANRLVTKNFFTENIKSVEHWAQLMSLEGRFFLPPLEHINLRVRLTFSAQILAACFYFDA